MSRAFRTNLTRYIDENGVTPDSLLKSEKKLAEHICKIVSNITEQPTPNPKAQIRCWSHLRNKKCTGKIAAGIDLLNFDILWQCLVCGNHGSIYKWEHSFIDHGFRA